MEEKSLSVLMSYYPERVVGNTIFIGAFTYGTPEIKSWNEGSLLKIGKFCSIADKVTIFLGGEHRTDWITTYPFSALVPKYAYIQGHPWSKGDVNIGNDVWIGSGATILSGVEIGDGCVIAANCVVAKDVPPYAIVAGNPSRIVRFRFREETINRLLQIQWWNWPLDKIEVAIPRLLSGDVDAFLQY